MQRSNSFESLWFVGMDSYSYVGYESILHVLEEKNISLDSMEITENFLFLKQQHMDLQNKHGKGYT